MIRIVQVRKANGELGGLTYAATGDAPKAHREALGAFLKLYRTPGAIVGESFLPQSKAEAVKLRETLPLKK